MAGALTDVAGVLVGHAHDLAALTGCTVVLLPPGTVAGVDVRGGAPGTRETDLLAPNALVQHIHAICLCGGSAFGLAAATGVVSWLREQGVGFETGVARVPIVPAAVLFDLALGRADRWPDEAMGYAACAAATPDSVAEGNVGAGAGASVGKLLGMGHATKSGVGSAALRLHDGTLVAALVVTNAWGDVRRDSHPDIIAGARVAPDSRTFLDMGVVLRTQSLTPPPPATNTTLAVIVTDALLDKAGCQRLALMAHDGMARTIRPVHTPFDGDVVFAAATGARQGSHLTALGSAAADVLAEAIERSVLLATGAGGLPGAADWAALTES
jgi:L-aminopeptidase/D-esterase-like protein